MKLTSLVECSALRGAVLVAAFTSVASAQNQTWIRQFGSSAADSATAVTADGAGGVFLCGNTSGNLFGSNAGQGDAWLARYDAVGNRTWLWQFGSSLFDSATAVAPDGVGGVYVCGVTYGSLAGASQEDAWLARYDGAGTQTWIRQLGTDDSDSAHAATADGAGGVYLAGSTTGSHGASNAGGLDAWLARYDDAGNVTLIQQLGTSAIDLPSALVADGAGGVFVCGSSGGSLGGPSVGSSDAWLARYDGGIAYTSYCSAIPNSTGQPGILGATGGNSIAVNEVTLEASQLPPSSFGFFLTSLDQGDTYPVSGSQGRLCLAGFLGRFVGPGQVVNSGPTGSFSLAIDLWSIPQPFGSVAAQPGETWSFQAWHRDANPTTTSSFTDAIAVVFL